MSYPIVLLPAAKQDIRITAHWYESQKKGLGSRFADEVRKATKYISSYPNASMIRYKTVRSYPIPVFPFMIHYVVDELNKRVVVFGVFHTALNPDQWEGRLSES